MPAISRLTLFAPSGLPMVAAGDDLALLILDGLRREGEALQDGDVVVVAQKIVSKAEGRLVDLTTVFPSVQATTLAEQTGKDPRIVEVILGESKRLVRWRYGSMIMEHRLGLIMAHAGVDQSNVADPKDGEYALLLPLDPDASAERIRSDLAALTGRRIAVVINDSFGRPWRLGTVGVAIGAAGLPALVDRRGDPDLFGRSLAVTVIAFADEIAAAASLQMGQADEARPVVVMRGLSWSAAEQPARALIRPASEDLFT